MATHAPKPDNRLLLPTSRAFVLQFTAQADVTQGVFTGRVEHVESGQAVRFATLDELLVFLGRVLNQTGET